MIDEIKKLSSARSISDAVDQVKRIVASCPRIYLNILEVYWLNSYEVAKEGVTLLPTKYSSQPYWKNGSENIDTKKNVGELLYENLPKYSAVYNFNITPKPQLKVKIEAMDSIVGKLTGQFSKDDAGKSVKLKMGLQNFIFEGDFTIPSAGTTIEVTLTFKENTVSKSNKLEAIGRYSAQTTWTVELSKSDGSTVAKTLKNQIQLEFFSVYKEPASFYDQGVWVEALRFLFSKVSGLQGQNNEIRSARVISNHLFYNLKIVYDTSGGTSFFVDNVVHRGQGGDFRLRGYLLNTYTKTGVIKKDFYTRNCYDQAGIVQALLGAVGIDSDWIFMQPYGYIQETNLIGVGRCNNPFYTSRATSKIETSLSRRSGFGNHAFIRLVISSNIIDACAGPHLATETFLQYAKNSIEVVLMGGVEYPNKLSTVMDVESLCWTYGYPCKGIEKIDWGIKRK